MEKLEAVKLLNRAADISEKILFGEDGEQRSDENIRFILQIVNQTVQASVKPDFEKVMNVIFNLQKEGRSKDA